MLQNHASLIYLIWILFDQHNNIIWLYNTDYKNKGRDTKSKSEKTLKLSLQSSENHIASVSVLGLN